MKKTSITLIIIASILTIIGLVLLFLGIKDNSFRKTDPDLHETEYSITESFTNLSVNAKSGDILIHKSNEDTSRVVCTESDKLYYNVDVSDNTLTINYVDERDFVEKLAYTSFNYHIDIYLGNSVYNNLDINNTTGDVSSPAGLSFKNVNIHSTTADISFMSECSEKMTIKATTGDINLSGFNTKELYIDFTTGDLSLSNINVSDNITVKQTTGKSSYNHIRCTNFSHTSYTGKTTLNDLIVSSKLYIHKTSGDINFTNCDAKEIIFELTTGDVEGSFLTPKHFDVHSTTGDVNVPNTNGDPCTISVTTGYINITINN